MASRGEVLAIGDHWSNLRLLAGILVGQVDHMVEADQLVMYLLRFVSCFLHVGRTVSGQELKKFEQSR